MKNKSLRRNLVGLVWLELMAILLLNMLVPVNASSAQASATVAPTAAFSHIPGIAPPDFFGVVGRDPWYEWNTNPRYSGSNLEFLENMASELKNMGAHYIRIEFRADMVPGARGGQINWAKYDAFINDIAPRYGLKVLGLLGYTVVNWDAPGDKDLHYSHYNDPADQPDGTNPLIRMYASRASEVIAHYGNKVATWEILNEFNYWEGVSLRPEQMASLMVLTYGLGKTANPAAQIIVGAQLALQKPSGPINSIDYLNAFYKSAPVQNYFSHPHPAPFENNPFPWDGLAWHPYFTNVNEAVASVRQVLTVMRGWGDHSKLWITEIGVPASFAGDTPCGTSQSSQETAQADYLSQFFMQLVYNNLNDIGGVFWFKYEDFYDPPTGSIVPLGVVRLQTQPGNPTSYDPAGRVARYKPAYYTFQRLAGPDLPTDSVLTSPTGNAMYFSETGHSLSGPFLTYWQNHGGLALFGFPLTEPFEELNLTDGKRYTVQYFERERFELHPENQPPYNVLLGLLGSTHLTDQCRGFAPVATPASQPPTDPTHQYFPQTGHNLGGGFKTYWDSHGGLAIFGYPISEEIPEVSPTDGKPYTVQYFERARFEFHPEAPSEYTVQLALLGSELLQRRGWLH